MNPAFSREALSLKNALALLAQAVADDRHEFWGMRQPVARAIHGLESRFQGYRQLTDGYLLSLAKQQKGVLATFDSGVQSLGLTDFSSWLEIVPTA
jgi:predicted nucleic acid-binding protein